MSRWGRQGARAGVVAVLALGACLSPEGTRCADGIVCPSTLVCAPVTTGCADPAQVDACVGRAEGAECTLAGIGNGLCRDGLCVVAGCGDGVQDVGEACDDGNEIDDDACTNACALPTCGDGIRQSVEACDEGAANGDDRACTSRCLPAACGDGLVWAGQEACDAGAANADDGPCTTACARALCGDGLVWSGVELCDDGNQAGGDGCRADCGKVEVCDDAVVDLGEACDDGNANPADGCDACGRTAWTAAALAGGASDPTEVGLFDPMSVAVDRAGNVYVADTLSHRVRRLDAATGTLATVAGTGVAGTLGDGGAATSAQLFAPSGVAVDGLGNVYIADRYSHRVRRVDARTGRIRTIAGVGSRGNGGDGAPATSTALDNPRGVAVDGVGDVYVGDTANGRVRKISLATGLATTVATDVAAFGLAVSATHLYIASVGEHRIYRWPLAGGALEAIAGTGTSGGDGDGGLALDARLSQPVAVAVDGAGGVVIADLGNHRIRRIDPGTQTISTIAGTGIGGFAGDGGLGTAASLQAPFGVAVAPDDAVWIADTVNQRVRRLDRDTQTISTAVGNGVPGSVSDGNDARSANLRFPAAVAVDATGHLYIADRTHQRVRRVDAFTHEIQTIAGTGASGFGGDGGPATAALLRTPNGVAVDAMGNVFIADSDNYRVRRVDAATGLISTFAGNGSYAYAGDGGPATAAALRGPAAVAVGPDGALYLSDPGNHVIRRVDPTTGVIDTVAGNGVFGSGGDGGAATAAQLAVPAGISFGAGALFIADTNNHRVRRVELASGIIDTVAGDGTGGFSGDGGPATSARLQVPNGVAFGRDGRLYVADTWNERVRRVDLSTGVIETVAGTGAVGFTGDAGPAGLATLDSPYALAAAPDGGIVIVEQDGHRVRRFDPGTGSLSTLAGRVDPEGLGPLPRGTLVDARAIALAPEVAFVAGGASGTLQGVWLEPARVEVVAGRYPQPGAVTDLARYRGDLFGDVGGVAHDPATGTIYLTETTGHRVWRVTPVVLDDPTTWTLAAVVGDGTAGFGDGAAATARLRAPTGLFLDADAQRLLIADTGNHVVRALDLAAMTVSTVAGTPATLGYFGDGLVASEALLFSPTAMTRCPSGDLYVADTGNQRVRRVASGTDVITTVLGDGVAASSGEGSPATTFPVDGPRGLACDARGNLFVTSTTAVRLLPADIPLGATVGVVDGTGAVQTIFGATPRDTFPASSAACLTAAVTLGDSRAWFADACAGLLVELERVAASP